MKVLLISLITNHPEPVTGEKVSTSERLREVVETGAARQGPSSHCRRAASACEGGDEWHRSREEAFRDPLGWSSLNALHWLVETDSTFPDLPGSWRANADEVVLIVSSSEAVFVDGEEVPIDSAYSLFPAEGPPGITLRHRERLIEVIRRTGDVALRLHDPFAPTLASYNGIPVYDPTPGWVVTGLFHPYEESREMTTGAVVEGLVHRHSAAGTVTFEIDGTEYELVLFGAAGALREPFTDATSGVTTHPAPRILDVGTPDENGRMVLDFQPCIKPAVCLHRLRDLPGGPVREQAGHRRGGGGEEPSMTAHRNSRMPTNSWSPGSRTATRTGCGRTDCSQRSGD